MSAAPIKDGGLAFPCDALVKMAFDHVTDREASVGLQMAMAGMTLRDYFAAKAMQGFIAARHPDHHGDDGAEILASDAYLAADAMLKARAA